MAEKINSRTYRFTRDIFITSYATVTGPKEYAGPIGAHVDYHFPDNLNGEASWEKSEQKLQSYVMVSVEKFLAAKGRKVIGWDEILEGGLGPDATVHSWRGMGGAVEAVKQGHDAILSPTSHCYFDYDQEKVTQIDKVYSLNPVPEGFDSEKMTHILGVQANVWTEYMPTFGRVQYMLLPRLAALSEVQWSQPGRMDYSAFLQRLRHLAQIYDKYGYNYAKVIDIFK